MRIVIRATNTQIPGESQTQKLAYRFIMGAQYLLCMQQQALSLRRQRNAATAADHQSLLHLDLESLDLLAQCRLRSTHSAGSSA